MLKVYYFLELFYDLYREFRIQKKFNRRFLSPYLKQLEQKFEGNFSEALLKKIENYYCQFIPVLLCSRYKKLYGKRLSETERTRAMWCGILTPVFDDLIDAENYSLDYLPDTIEAHQAFIPHHFLEKVAKEIQSRLLISIPNKKEYFEAINKAYKSQIDSLKQKNKEIASEDIFTITYEKGGAAFIVFRNLIDEPMSEDFESAQYTIGFLFQISNDIFDIHKDVTAGICTLSNTVTKFSKLKKITEDLIYSQNDQIDALPFSSKRKLQFKLATNIINARSLVGLDHLHSKFKTSYPLSFNFWESKARSETIIDMENPILFFKWLIYSWRLAKSRT